MGTENLQNVGSEKILGINQNLSWAEHLKKTAATVNSKVALLRKIKSFLPLSTRKLFSNTHILPHMDNCSIIWGSSPHVHSLLLAQKRASRIILDIKDTMYPSREMFSKLKWIYILLTTLNIVKQSWYSKVLITCHLDTCQICFKRLVKHTVE